MENTKRLEQIFNFIIRSYPVDFGLTDLKIYFNLDSTEKKPIGYTFIIKTSADYEGMEIKDLTDYLNETEDNLHKIFSNNIINSEYKLSDGENFRNKWVGILLNNLNASHSRGIINCEWEIMVELN